HQKVGGPKDRSCAGEGITPITLGHGNTCPVPCSATVIFDMNDVASCAACMAGALEGEGLNAAYGARPPAVPTTVGLAAQPCQKNLAKAAGALTLGWARALADCEDGNARAFPAPPVDCTTDPEGAIA